MRSRRAICVSRDGGLRRVIEATLAAAGIAVEHVDGIPETAGDAALVLVDRATREAAGAALGAIAAPVVIVGDDLDDDALIATMLEAPVSHLVEDPHDRDLGITSEKIVSGDLFGVEKYLARGTRITERVIASDTDKRHALGAITAWADALARKPIVHRLANVADELMMNALYDTPGAPGPSPSRGDRWRSAAEQGSQSPYGEGPAEGSRGDRWRPTDRRAELRWGADEHVLALSVSDRFGALRQRDVIDHVRRARNERGRPRPETHAQRGAGLGLYLVLANVASLVINVEAGKRTEVVCLFDRARAGHPAVTCVRSLHVFQAAAS
ncbi:MAG TPA: hypothetical protein VH165_07395 [Kofleriaceae bacterium]|jgi:hypothetical protein|nr:hypothetical protein [Kofleriaceae bacterium]